MSGHLRFVAFIVVATCVFVLILHVVLRSRSQRPSWTRLLITAIVVVAGGMIFAKVGQNNGLPWWIYYTIPMLATVLVPPVVFRMTRYETPAYLVLAFVSSPVIHVLFSFFLGWKEYMPFIEIPALWEL
jgi:hypothetical protein